MVFILYQLNICAYMTQHLTNVPPRLIMHYCPQVGLSASLNKPTLRYINVLHKECNPQPKVEHIGKQGPIVTRLGLISSLI